MMLMALSEQDIDDLLECVGRCESDYPEGWAWVQRLPKLRKRLERKRADHDAASSCHRPRVADGD